MLYGLTVHSTVYYDMTLNSDVFLKGYRSNTFSTAVMPYFLENMKLYRLCYVSLYPSIRTFVIIFRCRLKVARPTISSIFFKIICRFDKFYVFFFHRNHEIESLIS